MRGLSVALISSELIRIKDLVKTVVSSSSSHIPTLEANTTVEDYRLKPSQGAYL